MRSLTLAVALVAAGCYQTSFDNGQLACSELNTCPDGYSCQSDTCWQNGSAGMVGAHCSRGSDCISGVCGAFGCTQDCSDRGYCPAGFACVLASSKAWMCFPDCAGPSDCERYTVAAMCGAFIDRAGDTVAICSL
jgi:hypothetical protein